MSESNGEEYKLLLEKIDEVCKEVKDINSKLFDHRNGIAVNVRDNTQFIKSAKKQVYAIWIVFLGLIGRIMYGWWNVNK